MVLKKIILEHGLNSVIYEDDNSKVERNTMLYFPISTLEDTSYLQIRTVDDIQYLPIGTLADIRAKGKGTEDVYYKDFKLGNVDELRNKLMADKPLIFGGRRKSRRNKRRNKKSRKNQH